MREVDAATHFGVNRRVLREHRKELAEGEDWTMEENAVTYTPTGLERLQGLLCLGEVSPPPLEELTVVNRARNPRLVFARRANGDLVRLRVRSNENFLPGMRAQGQHEAADVWTLAQRLPRWRGRW